MDPKTRRTTFAAGGTTSGIPTSVSRPSALSRQSLAPSSSINNNNNNNNPRQSLAPSRGLGASRTSTAFASSSTNVGGGSQSSQQFSQGHGGPPVAPGTASRNNNFYSSVGSMSVGRSGALRGSQAEIPYAPPSERRSSVYRRATTLGGATTPSGSNYTHVRTAAMKDPRDVKGSKKRYAEDIAAFLASRNYHPPAEVKALLAPTGAQFISIFKFLIQALDPGYRFPPAQAGQLKKPEEEVPPAMRTVCYPFADSITKSHLQSVGSQQTWPNMLAMLHWLVVMIQNREDAFNNCQELHIPAPFDEARPHVDAVVHAWLDYIGQSYPKFLASDDFDPDPELAQFYEQTDNGRRTLIARVAELKQEKEALQRELQHLADTPDPLIAAVEERGKVERDIAKFDDYLDKIAKKMEGQKLRGKMAVQEQARAVQERDEAANRLREIETQFKAQGMTEGEIQHLSTERTNLAYSLQAITAKHQLLQTKSLNSEIELTRALSTAESLCATYTSKAEALGLLPFSPDGFETINFEQEINGALENPVMDCLTYIKPALVELRTRAKEGCAKTQSESIVLEEQITREKESLGELKEELESHAAELKQEENHIKEMKETAAVEISTLNNGVEKLQTQVNHLNTSAGQNLAVAEWRLEQRTLERASVLIETSDIRTQNRELLEAALDNIITYKSQMMKQTDTLLELAEADL